MANKNTSHFAGEFLVAGELSRRGYPVSITMGRAKAVDIYAETSEFGERGEPRTIRIDVKAAQTKSWVVGTIKKDVYYVFVYLGTTNKIKANKPPEYFIIRGEDIKENSMRTYGKKSEMIEIAYQSLEDCRNKWQNLPTA